MVTSGRDRILRWAATPPRRANPTSLRRENTMHAVLGALASILLVAGLAAAGDDKKDHATPTTRMAECNALAADKKLAGDARKQFMSECLKGPAARDEVPASAKTSSDSHSAEGKHNSQGEKMKTR